MHGSRFVLRFAPVLLFSLASPASAQVTELLKLGAANGEPGDRFGAALDVDGDLAVVGAQGEEEGGPGAGAAYVFEREGGEWVQTAQLQADPPGSFRRFGAYVAVHDGRIVVSEIDAPVGGPGSQTLGVVHVFERGGDGWVETAQLVAEPLDGIAQALGPVALFGDTVVVGDPLQDAAGIDSGAIYIFEHSAGGWGAAQRFLAPDAAAEDRFGNSLSVQDARILVGAPGDSDAALRAGAAYVLERTRGAGAAGAWSVATQLVADPPQTGSNFGVSVSLGRERALVGAGLMDGDGFDNRGGAYVFTESHGSWEQEALLVPRDAGTSDEFGASVDLLGQRAIGGSRNHPAGARFGAAFVFERSGGQWIDVAKLTSSKPKIGERLGEQVRLTGDSALVSTSLYQNSIGAVFYYERAVAGAWLEAATAVGVRGGRWPLGSWR